MNQQDEEFNPFQAPEVPFSAGNPANGSVDAIRHEYLSHEASVQSIGFLYFLGGALILVASIGLLFAAIPGPVPIEMTLIAWLLPVVAILQLATGYGLRKLKSWARIPTALFSVLGLFAFPLGTLINGYILYLILSPKAKMVFSEEYRQVIDQTPHIKYKTSIIVWIFLIFLLALIGMGIVAALIG